MNEGYRARSREHERERERDDYSYRRSSPRRYDDRDRDRDRDRDQGHDRDASYRRSRRDAHSPPRNLNYDDEDDYNGSYHDDNRHRRYSGSYNRDGSRGHGDSRYSASHHEAYPSRRQNGPPGKTIVIDNVPLQATEQDILYGLDYASDDLYTSTNRVHRVRFDYDHNNRRIALVDFNRRDDAENFMNSYQPEISFPLEHSAGKDSKVLTFDIHFAGHSDLDQPPRVQRASESNWYCAQCPADNYPHRDFCYKCKAPRPLDDDGYGHTFGAPSGPILTGETDESPQGGTSQYLVIRDLGESVTEEILSKGVMKLFLDNTAEPTRNAPNPLNKLKSTAPTNSTTGLGAKPGSLRRVFLMRDRRTGESRKYGFAEFATLEDAIGAMAKYRGYGDTFTIASKIVKVGFIHAGVFVPADESTNPTFTFAPIINPTLRLRYWDERVYPSVFDVAVEPLPESISTDKQGERGETISVVEKANTNKTFKVKKAKKDQESAPAIKITMNPEIQRWTMKSVELHGKAQKSTEDSTLADGKAKEQASGATPQSNDNSAETGPDGPADSHWTDQYASYADWDRLACLVCGWVAPSQKAIDKKGYSQFTREELLIDHEVRVHNHYKDTEVKEKAAEKLAALNKEPRTIVRRNPRLKSEALPVYTSYADLKALRCLICKRNFKHVEVLWRHEQESELHKRMLSDPKNIERAIKELEAKGKTPHTMVPDKQSLQDQQEQNPQYRDRAKERRQVFKQPKKPAPVPATPAEKRKENANPSSPEEVPVVKTSKGAGMLAKMGWTAGAGLGAEGTGRTEAIAVDAYVEGVGLGAEGYKLGDASEEAARKTRGHPSDFIEKTRDKARERFEKL